MMSNPTQITCEMKICTCGCGAFYGVPNWVNNYRCPMCTQRVIDEAYERLKRKAEESSRKDRVIQGLRGAITRLKGR